jgi:hypothetical protein
VPGDAGKPYAGNFSIRTYLGIQSGVTVLFNVNSIRMGFYMNDFNAIINNYREDLQKNYRSVQLKKNIVNGITSCRLTADGNTRDGSLVNHTMLSIANGRYYVITILNPAKGGLQQNQIDSVFGSFTVTEPVHTGWKRRKSNNGFFSAVVPADFQMPDSTMTNPDTQELVYDSCTANTLLVQWEKISPYEWHSSVDSFWMEYKPGFDSSSTIIRSSVVKNSDLPAYEWVSKFANAPALERYRFILAGRTLYKLNITADSAYIFSNDAERFFAEFKAEKNATDASVFSSTTNTLLADLKSRDADTRTEARQYLPAARFEPADTALLKASLFDLYLGGSILDTSANINYKLARILRELDEQAFLHLIAEKYPSFIKESRKREALLALQMLAEQLSPGSTELLASLLNRYPIPGRPSYFFSAYISENLTLAKQLLLSAPVLLRDSLLGLHGITIVKSLSDSGLLDKSHLMEYKRDIIRQSTLLYNEFLHKDTSYFNPHATDLLSVVALLPATDAFPILRQFSRVHDLQARFTACMKLLRMNQPVSQADLLPFAKDLFYRIELYDELADMNKTSLYPAVYRNRRSFADAYMYMLATDEEDPDQVAVDFIEIRKKRIGNKEYDFYLYKISVQQDDGKKTFLGVCGGYLPGTASLKPDKDWAGIAYDLPYNEKQIGRIFSDYMLSVLDDKRSNER